MRECGFGSEAVWDCHGTWVIYHWVLERLAAHAGIEFDMPEIIEADTAKGIAVVVVCGRILLSTRVDAAWSIGEAHVGKNYKIHGNMQPYPWAMAEKRAKDRVILKLLGLQGEVWSEEEADDFKRDQVEGKVTMAKKAFNEFCGDIDACSDMDSLEILLDQSKNLMERFEVVIPEYVHGGGDVPSLAERIHNKRKELDADSINT